MHILVTNDDGVTAPGILALAQAMRPLGKVTVLGPDRNWSGGGHVKTVHRPLRVNEVTLDDGSTAFASDGAPSDCVALALLGFIPEKIDLVVSGINPHANMGHDVTYSGTVTAAMEAVISGVPGIAFSLAGNDLSQTFHFDVAAGIAQRIVKKVFTQGLMPDLLLNVNIPNTDADNIRGIRITRQGMRVYNAALDDRQDPRGRPYYWIGGSTPSGIPDDGTDFGAISEGFVSITPLDLDLTEYRRTMQLRTWSWEDEPEAEPSRVTVNLVPEIQNI
ncbi:MAG: stationary phase survival protein SurE [Anaerolineae bacterium SG8_19]|jgi:5'-nucleotidase|nr:MAG: stationary phase survival protein SurE [Anaerolineae bacterium SG8_19]